MDQDKTELHDRERNLIEKVAKTIVNRDMEFFAIMLLETVKPVAWISGELSHFYLAAFLPLLDDKGYDFIDTFEQRNNIEALIKRVKQLVKEKEKQRENVPTTWDKIKSKFSILSGDK